MATKSGMKRSRNLEKSASQANKYKARRLHQIKSARENHLKNALQSCGKEFVETLKEYYSRNPVMNVGKRLGAHRGEIG